MQQFGNFMSIWKADEVPLPQKLQLYSAGVVSRLTHGHETWRLDRRTRATITGWNARCLAIITGNSIADECRNPTFALVEKLRARRLRWAGQVLRQNTDQSLVKQVLIALVQTELDPDSTLKRPHLDLLMDAPEFNTLEELLALAEDTHGWATEVRKLDPDLQNNKQQPHTEIVNEPTTLDHEAPEWHKCYFY